MVMTGLSTQSLAAKSAMRWICRTATGPMAGREVAIGTRPIVLGADGSCDIVLTDATVSRKHAEIQVTADGILVRDLGSTNGTFVRGMRVETAVLTTESSVRLGNANLTVLPCARPMVPASDRRRFGSMIGQSVAMREAFAVFELAAPTEVTVLIEGESGTGKELAASALHDHSPRAKGPFVVVDCSAAHDQLLDSQLFGHKTGAFTGASHERKGAFIEAHGGTLFLDELGELPLLCQAKLLRALEARTVQPLGSDRSVAVDVRVIAATNRDLSAMVEAKQFRFDLFHRLAVVHLRIPPLRERLEDIPLLVRHFYEGRGIDPGEIAGENLRRLECHEWPGNVRELRNALERAFVLSGPHSGKFSALNIMFGSLGHTVAQPQGSGNLYIDTTLPFKEAKEAWNDQFERRYIATVWEEHERNISRAAEHSGINRNHFRKLLEKHGLIEP
jgi:DNA-binding NtrC family response regulator